MPDTPPPGFEDFANSLGGQDAGPAPASVPDQSAAAPAPPPGFEDFANQTLQDQYGGGGQQAIAGVEGALQGVAGPAAPWVEKQLGVKPEDIRMRAEANPWTHGLSEAAGFGGSMLTGVGEGALIGKLGEVGAKVGELGQAGSIAAKLTSGAARLGTEMAAIQASDEGTKAVTEAPNWNAGDAVVNTLLSGALGAVGGGALSGAGMLARGALEKSGLGNVISDYKDRLIQLGSSVTPVEKAMNEVEQNVNAFRGVGSDIGGFNGLKGAALQKVLPEAVTPEISNSVQDIVNKSQDALKEMRNQGVPERLIQKFQSRVGDLMETVTDPNASVMDHFDAVNDYKKDLANFSKGNFGPFSVAPHEEAYDFLNITKSLGHDIKISMENPEVWGKDAADLQKSLNATWSGAKKYVEQTESKLMSKVGETMTPDPAKFNTYFNQAGKAASPTIRQQIMDGFVTKMDAFHDAVASAYEKAGIEAPERPGLSALRDSVDKPSIGSRLADASYQKLGAKALGQGIGSTLGGALGHVSGIPGAGYAGTFIGGKLGDSVLPTFIQPLLEKSVNSKAFQASMNFGQSIIKGDKMLSNSAKALFSTGELIPKHLMPNDDNLEKLDKQTQALGQDQSKMFNVGADLTHYMPNHAMALSQTAMNAVKTINAIRPQNPKRFPLDTELPPSAAQKQSFKRSLAIAQQPLSIMQHVKQGTLLPQDVMTLKAIYPQYYEKMKQQIYSAMTDHLADGGTVPFKLKQTMSMFFGQPLDSNLSPANIMAAQAVFAKQKMASAPPMGPAPKKNTNALAKVSGQYQTREQAAQSRQSKA